MEGFRILTFVGVGDTPSSYRGVYRWSPSDCQGMFDMDALWMTEAHAEDDAMLHHDLAAARHFLMEYRTIGIPCELIWLKVGECQEGEGIGRFLGYDVAWVGGYSVIACGLVHHTTLASPRNDIENAWGVLYELSYRYFYPLLSEYGLFPDYETAEFFRQVEHAFQTLNAPVEQDGYEVIGVFEVDPWERTEANLAVEAAFLARLEEHIRKIRMSGGTNTPSEG